MKNMTKKDSQLFSSLMFYAFTLFLTLSVFAFPVMAYFNHATLSFLLTLLVISFALLSSAMVMLQKCYWLASSSISTLFQKCSLPLIGQEWSHEIICNLQMKLFKPLRSISIFIVACFGMLIILPSNPLKLSSIYFGILLQFSCWSFFAIMAIDGIFTYSVCLFEIAMQLLVNKGSKRLQKVNLKTMYANLKSDFAARKTYSPKRLSTADLSTSEKTFSLKTFVMETNIKLNSIMKNSIIKAIRHTPSLVIMLILLTGICSTAEATPCNPIENIETTLHLEEVQSSKHTGWFYEQLSETEKIVYDGFWDNREQLMDGQEVSIFLSSGSLHLKENEDIFKRLIMTAKRAYLADHPAEKIWMDNCKLFLRSGSGTLQMIVRPQGKLDTREASETFEQIANEFLENLSGTDREKLEAIHNWLISNVQYDLTAEHNSNAYGAIVEGRSVCSGFAYSFKYLADKAGLNVVYVQGYYYNSTTNTYGYHAWNMAEIDGEWLLIDVTLDNSLRNFSLFSWQDFGAHHPDPLFTYPS